MIILSQSHLEPASLELLYCAHSLIVVETAEGGLYRPTKLTELLRDKLTSRPIHLKEWSIVTHFKTATDKHDFPYTAVPNPVNYLVQLM